MFLRLKREYEQKIKSNEDQIHVTLQDGRIQSAIAFKTTPMEILKSVKDIMPNAIISKVDGELYDLIRPLEKSCRLEFLSFDLSAEARAVFWHSSAHILGEASERHYGCHLCIGPPLDEGGFYYEMDIPEPRKKVVPQDYPQLETLCGKISDEKQTFERLLMSKADLLEMFKHNPFKVHLIKEKIQDYATVYRCGPLVDLCRGPHVPNTGYVKALAVLNSSASYFLGDQKNASIQRIYGISFPKKKQLEEHLKFLEEAKKRDHRDLGKKHELFFFHELSPGACFFLPHGAHIYNTLVELQRKAYRNRGFQEVVTPNVFNTKLWETSGHWENYQENMFCFDIEKEKYALKPMNCPGHCLLFAHRTRSYAELPIRFADFGVLHRNELSGALTGLTRVRRFQQDDAHIFCTVDQIESEMTGCLEFLKEIYGIFGFEFSMKLATRPQNYLGEISVWEEAEKRLENSLVASKFPFTINHGDGAFYGPKIDITISDALKRQHQCATIQLDFQLPERFNLTYQTGSTENKLSRPVIIHRAILGSVERMIAILTEHFAAKWPFWLSPRQVIIIPVAHAFNKYAQFVRDELYNAGLCAEADVTDFSLKRKVLRAENSLCNFTVIVGSKEEDSTSVNVRIRDNADTKAKNDMIKLDVFKQQLLSLRDSKALKDVLK